MRRSSYERSNLIAAARAPCSPPLASFARPALAAALPLRAPPGVPERARGHRRRAARLRAARHRRDRRPQRLDGGTSRVQRPVASLRAHVLQGEQGAPPDQRRVPRPRLRELGMLFNGTTDDDRVNYFFTTTSDHFADAMALHARRGDLAALRRQGARAGARRRHRRDGPGRVGLRGSTSGAP